MQLLIAVVIGIVVGAVWQEGFGALVGAALAWLLVRTMRQERAIADLRKAIAERPMAGAAIEPARADARVATTPTSAVAPANGADVADDTRPMALEDSAPLPAAPAVTASP